MNKYIYCSDASGLSVSYMMNTLNTALKIKELSGLRYLHNPRTLRNLEHGLVDEAETLFALGQGEACAEDYEAFKRSRGLKELLLPAPDERYRNIIELVHRHDDGVVFVAPPRVRESDYRLTRSFILEKYRKARAARPIPYRLGRTWSICVHIRAGDIYEKTRWRDVRALPLRFYEELLRQIVQEVGWEYHVFVFTQTPRGRHAREFDLSRIRDWPKTTLFADNDFAEDFHNMLCADLFVGSKSFLSHLLASLRSGPSIVPKTAWLHYAQAENLIEIEPGTDGKGHAHPVLREDAVARLWSAGVRGLTDKRRAAGR